MKEINFIKTVSPERNREINLWFTFSMLIIGIVILIILGLQSLQVCNLYTTCSLKNSLLDTSRTYDTITQEKNDIAAKKKLLVQQLTKINNKIENPKMPHEYLKIITNACTSSKSINQIKIHKKIINFNINCPHTDDALQIAKTVSSSPYIKHVRLQSITQENNQIQASFIGSLT